MVCGYTCTRSQTANTILSKGFVRGCKFTPTKCTQLMLSPFLFTKVTLHEIVDILGDFISVHTLRSSSGTGLFVYALKTCVFYFEGEAFKQIGGLAMESPLGPTLGYAVLDSIERKFHDNILNSFFTRILRSFRHDCRFHPS